MRIVLSVRGEGSRRTFRFAREVVTVGRATSCVLTLDDPALSRMHCQIEIRHQEVFVRDLNSSNGTFLEDRSVECARWDPGSVLHIGTSELVFDGLESERDAGGIGHQTQAIWRQVPRRGNAAPDLATPRVAKLLAVTAKLLGDLDEEAVLSRIIDGAIDLSGAERGFLLLFAGDAVSVEIARTDWRRDIDDPEVEISRGIAQEVRARGEGVLIEDAGADARVGGFQSVADLALRSVLCVPLRFEGEIGGVLYLDHRLRPQTFSETELELMEAFADLAALALTNSGRYRDVRRDKETLEERVRRSEAELARAREALAQRERRHELRFRYEGIVARSAAMQRLLSRIDRVIPTDLAVLLVGPDGTGKEALGRILHAESPRAAGPFVVLTCAALPQGLAEVELFGHAGGAFTGADEARPGLLEEASGGTLFFEGIEDLALPVQAALLRVLEHGEFRRPGSDSPTQVDVRLVAASRSDLRAAVDEGRFREDLYYRLAGVALTLPTLAERSADLPLLLDALLAEEAPEIELDPELRRHLLTRPWPGNLVELRNEMRRLALFGPGLVTHAQIRMGEVPAGDRPLRDAVDQLEREMIQRVVQEESGNISRSADRLGLSRVGLRKKMTRLGLREGGSA